MSPEQLAFRVDGFNPWSLAINRKDRAGTKRNGQPYRYKTSGHNGAADELEIAARQAVQRQGVRFMRGPVELVLMFRAPRRSKAWGDCGPAADIDGPFKAIFDALVAGGAMSNDVQVVKVTATKTLGPHALGIIVRKCAVDTGA